MGQISTIYDCLILGNEPAGLWFLNEYHRLQGLVPKTPPRPSAPVMCWAKIGKTPLKIAVAEPINHHFNLGGVDRFSAQIVSALEVWDWNGPEIRHRFPELPIDFESRFLSNLNFPTSLELSNLRSALSRHPELLTYSTALWKSVGRSREATAEQIIWAALMAHSFVWWNPEEKIAKLDNVEIAELPATDTLSSIDLKEGIFTLNFQSGISLATSRLVLNLPYRLLNRLCIRDRSLIEWAHEPQELLSHACHYPLQLEVAANALPSSVHPLTLLLDCVELPEPDHEIWSLELSSKENGQSLRIWATDRYDFSLEGVSEKLKMGMGRILKLLPHLQPSIRSLSVPLGMDTCFTDNQRHSVTEQLEAEGVELYNLTTLHTHTRQKKLHGLFPFLNCSRPYPLGTLLGAEQVLKEIFGKKAVLGFKRLKDAAILDTTTT